jgi:hypothetical protein
MFDFDEPARIVERAPW